MLFGCFREGQYSTNFHWMTGILFFSYQNHNYYFITIFVKIHFVFPMASRAAVTAQYDDINVVDTFTLTETACLNIGHSCGSCNCNDASGECPHCHQEHYCSQTCQTNHWLTHKWTCSVPQLDLPERMVPLPLFSPYCSKKNSCALPSCMSVMQKHRKEEGER